jgi:hypothetical protein
MFWYPEGASVARRRTIGKLVEIQHGPATVSAEELLNKPLSPAGWEGERISMTRKSGDRPA